MNRKPEGSGWLRDWRVVTAGGLVLGVAVLLLWPAGLAGVENLDSRGTAIIAFGDSLTAGYGAPPEAGVPALLEEALGLPIINAGRNGDTTSGALARLEEDVLSRDPRIVIVGLGGNDFLRGIPVATTEENLRTIVARIQSEGAMVVLLGYRFPSLQTDYEAMYERIAGDEGALLVPDLLDGILSNPARRSDAIHPNAAGYGIIAARIEAPLRRLIAEADSRR